MTTLPSGPRVTSSAGPAVLPPSDGPLLDATAWR